MRGLEVRVRALSARQATRCENARTKRCRCRCGGLLHGKGRFTDAGAAMLLAADDPHRAGAQLTLFTRELERTF
jgi:hypothetical protein